MAWKNGQIPNDVVSVVLGSGRDSKGRYWEHRLTPATAARWAFAVAYALNKWGQRMYIRWGGPNAYRPLEFQRYYYQDGVDQGNPLQAAYPGTSSHGGEWRGRLCLAIDVDPGGLAWWQVWEACRAAGFECGLITKAIAGIDEPWHVIDFNAFGATPAFDGSKPFEEDDIMAALSDAEQKEMLANSRMAVLALGAGGLQPGMWKDEDTIAAVVRQIRSRLQDGGVLTQPQDNALMSVYSAIFFGGGDAGPESIIQRLRDIDVSGGGQVDVAELVAQLKATLPAAIVAEIGKQLTS